ncbi:hypothetical protein CASFOL_036990 [Castilleja foliolosa]|uniref:F-box associated domain-containing protein n=1 Tax=Castilleja foliolosa TaxID=1961234 RepID=A0ABD3BRT9_9LAMI
MKLWLKNNDVGWTLEMAVSLSSLGSNWMFPYLIGFNYDADIVLIKYGSEVVLYKLDDHSVRKVKVNLDEYFEFRSDLEPVHLGGGGGGRRLMSCIRSIKTLMCS